MVLFHFFSKAGDIISEVLETKLRNHQVKLLWYHQGLNPSTSVREAEAKGTKMIQELLG